ncbi:PepSY-associated TM helix domain-containing protein [soil metagenome]
MTETHSKGRAPTDARRFRRALSLKFAALARWLHIYVSMFGLAVVLFFSVTGLTLNHPDWFFDNVESSDLTDGQIDLAWLHAETDQVNKLEIVEYLRNTHDVRGALAEFQIDDYEFMVIFEGPGYSADAFIDRETGRYTLTQSYEGFIAVLNDLHTGRDTGAAWSWVIDISAVLLTLISLSGLILLFYLRLRRVAGVVMILIGAVIVFAVYGLWVP